MSHQNATKKLINQVSECERECNEGLVAVNPGLSLVDGQTVVVRTDAKDVVASGKVVLISGGGSGHEPAHAGYVGKGCLTACACGSVFTSPPPKCIMAAVDAACQGAKGAQILMVVTNYTGDRLNFGIALERARVKGHEAEMVVVGEDCALDSVDHSAGRRGLGGTVFIHKIAGAMAEQGMKLQEMVVELNKIKSNMGTIGLSLSPCSVPGSGPSFTLKQDEMELGLGIHGEAGVRRMKVQSAKETVKTMMDHMTNPQTSTHIDIKSGDRVALLVNNLGGSSVLELNIVAKEAISYLESRGALVDRAYSGTFITSLEMAGISISIMHLDDRIMGFLDYPASAPGWHPSYLLPGQKVRKTPGLVSVDTEASAISDAGAAKVDSATSTVIRKAVQNACEQLIKMEGALNDLDTQSGDGDTGSTLSRGAKAVLAQLQSQSSLPVDCPYALTLTLGQIAEDTMGGSSGALYSLFFTGVAQGLKTLDKESLCAAWTSGLELMMRYGGAKPGYRTMLDPLHSALECFKQEIKTKSVCQALKAAAAAGEAMAQRTVGMDAQAGRASYVHKDLLTKPDPGAVAAAAWLKALADTVE